MKIKYLLILKFLVLTATNQLQYKKLKLIISFFLMALCSIFESKAQKTEQGDLIEKYKSFYFELGESYYHFQDLNASAFVQKGLGWGSIGLGYQSTSNKINHDVNIFFEYGEAQYSETFMEDYTSIFKLHAKYSVYWVNNKVNKKHEWTFGGSILSDALYFVYPYLYGNNADTYSIDVFSLSPNTGFHYKLGTSSINLVGSIDFLSWNFRPQTYHGVSPEVFFSESKITSFHNNLKLNFKTSFQKQFRHKNKLELTYYWQFIRNTSTINKLNYAAHKFSLRYYLAKKGKQHEK